MSTHHQQTVCTNFTILCSLVLQRALDQHAPFFCVYFVLQGDGGGHIRLGFVAYDELKDDRRVVCA